MHSRRIWSAGSLLLYFAVGTALANVPGGNADRGPVTLKKEDENYILTNSAITVEIKRIQTAAHAWIGLAQPPKGTDFALEIPGTKP